MTRGQPQAGRTGGGEEEEPDDEVLGKIVDAQGVEVLESGTNCETADMYGQAKESVKLGEREEENCVGGRIEVCSSSSSSSSGRMTDRERERGGREAVCVWDRGCVHSGVTSHLSISSYSRPFNTVSTSCNLPPQSLLFFSSWFSTSTDA